MPTFPKGHHAYLTRIENAKMISRLNPDDRAAIRHTTAVFEFPNPADLRGFPVVGEGIAGHIRGTQPENAATR